MTSLHRALIFAQKSARLSSTRYQACTMLAEGITSEPCAMRRAQKSGWQIGNTRFCSFTSDGKYIKQLPTSYFALFNNHPDTYERKDLSLLLLGRIRGESQVRLTLIS